MNPKKTFVLALVLIAAVLYLTQVEMPGRESEAGQRMAFAKLEESFVEGIDVSRREPGAQAEERYSLARPQPAATAAPGKGGSEWSLPAIRGAVVDQSAVSEMLSTLRELSVEGPLSERNLNADLSVYGLSAPALTTVVHERDGRSTELAFGKKNEYLSKRYVKVSGRAGVFMVDEEPFIALNKGLSDVRSKEPFQFAIADVREVLLTSSQGRVKLTQPVVGEWKIVEPRELPASAEAVGEFLGAIQRAKVERFIDGAMEKKGQYGFNLPRASVIAVFREGIEPQQLSFQLANAQARTGGQELYAIASSSDTIFKLSSNPSDQLAKRVDDLRERRMVKLSASAIERLVSSGEGISPVEIVTKGVSWTVNGKDGDPEFVDDYLKSVSGLRAAEFPEQVPADAFAKPFVVLTLTKNTADKEVTTVTVGAEATGTKDPMRYARVSGSDTVYLIRDVEAKRIVPHEEVLIPQGTPTPALATTPS